MKGHQRARALTVVASATIALTVAAGAGTGAFGATGGHRFASAPKKARVGHIPNTLRDHSISRCPEGASSVHVSLMKGTTTYASASVTADAKGRWSVYMSIPSSLPVGTYAVTATCSSTAGVVLSYRPQTFRVIPPSCGPEPTTSTTAQCRPQPPPSPGNGSNGAPGAHG